MVFHRPSEVAGEGAGRKEPDKGRNGRLSWRVQRGGHWGFKARDQVRVDRTVSGSPENGLREEGDSQKTLSRASEGSRGPAPLPGAGGRHPGSRGRAVAAREAGGRLRVLPGASSGGTPSAFRGGHSVGPPLPSQMGKERLPGRARGRRRRSRRSGGVSGGEPRCGERGEGTERPC